MISKIIRSYQIINRIKIYETHSPPHPTPLYHNIMYFWNLRFEKFQKTEWMLANQSRNCITTDQVNLNCKSGGSVLQSSQRLLYGILFRMNIQYYLRYSKKSDHLPSNHYPERARQSQALGTKTQRIQITIKISGTLTPQEYETHPPPHPPSFLYDVVFDWLEGWKDNCLTI